MDRSTDAPSTPDSTEAGAVRTATPASTTSAASSHDRDDTAKTDGAAFAASCQARFDAASPHAASPSGRQSMASRSAGRGEDWLARVADMDEVELRSLVESLPLIEQAKGVLMGFYGVSAERAFAILRRWSSVHHVKIRDLAALLVDHTENDPPSRTDTDGSAGQWRPFHAIQIFLDQTGLG